MDACSLNENFWSIQGRTYVHPDMLISCLLNVDDDIRLIRDILSSIILVYYRMLGLYVDDIVNGE